MRWAMLALFALAACETSDPRVNAGVSVGGGGFDVYPSASMRVGGVGVTVTP